MINSWTKNDIESILIQLNNMKLPFTNYEFSMAGEGMEILGTGASAKVYAARRKGKNNSNYAIKVIGFGNRHADSDSFRNAVDAQRKLSLLDNNVVDIYDSTELRVWIEGDNNVIKAERIDTNDNRVSDLNCLHLQFVLMEKVEPVLRTERFKQKLVPSALEDNKEIEILKLAYEIGMAINSAHKNNLIHRDIKLENIFYDVRRHRYKLGDFGIARLTDNGMASTVAFTKGYGAPEVVGTVDDMYDYTADIYSFGMLLYVLLNDLRFPSSKDYHPSIFQYVQGYIPPEPTLGDDELVGIVLKMISYRPEDRYQTMEEVLDEFDKLKYGNRIKYQREHKNLALALGTLFALIGAGAWKLSFVENLNLVTNVITSLFFGMCILKGAIFVAGKRQSVINVGILLIGIYLMISEGFSWWKLLLLLFVLFSQYLSSIIGGCFVVASLTGAGMDYINMSVPQFAEYRWMAVLMISLSIILLFFYDILGQRNDVAIGEYLGANLYWIFGMAFYMLLIVAGYVFNTVSWDNYFLNIGIYARKLFEWSVSWEPLKVGIAGTCFTGFWIVRERLLIWVEKKLL